MGYRFVWTATLFGLLSGFTAGCSDSGGDGDGPLTAAQFAAQAAPLYCEGYGACCALDQHPYDGARCREEYASNLRDAATSPAMRFDGERARACVDAMRATAPQCDFTAEEYAACNEVIVGAREIGESCVSSFECAGFPNVDCSAPVFGGPAFCTAAPPAPPRGRAGDPCVGFGVEKPDEGGSLAVCYPDDGLFCSSASGTCAQSIAAGESCSQPGSCVQGAFCDSGTCEPARGAGESCLVVRTVNGGGLGFADPRACQPGLYCIQDGASATCVAPLPDGAICGTSVPGCASLYCDIECPGGRCAEQGVCTPPKHSSREFCRGDFGTGDGSVASIASLTMPLLAGIH